MTRGSLGATTFRARLLVLGVPIDVESNRRIVVQMARETHDEARGRVSGAAAAACVRIMVDEQITGGDLTPMHVRLSKPDRLSIRASGAVAHADGDLRTATARVAPACVTQSGFRESVLDHLALFLVTRADRVPLHAAAVARDDMAILLAAASGVGKSTLAYAMMKAGFRLLSDDAVYAQRTPDLRLWAMPGAIHLSPGAVVHFSELAEAKAAVRPDGRRKLVVPIPEGSRVPIPWKGRSALVLLASARRASSSVSLTVEEAMNAMRETAQGGFRRFEGELANCVRAVSAHGCWRLAVNEGPTALVRHIEALLASGR